ncbi:MAG: capsular exopolysaccharide family [Chlorobi bacterium]|nr:capsular exopolysaccharide family [Chlorobiota bacterium]
MKTSNNGSGPDDYGKGSPYGNGDSGRGQSSRALARRSGSLGSFRRQGSIQEANMIPSSLIEQQEKRRFSFGDYMGLLWRGKWIILCCIIVAGVAAAYYTYSQPFVYKSSLQIIINEQDRNMSPLLGSETWYWQPPERVLKKELQILTSQPILQQTAERLIAQRYLDTIKRDTVIPVVVSSERALGARHVQATPEEKQAALATLVASSIRALITFRPSKEADIIQIVTLAGDPREAALITNVYAQVYAQDNQEQNRSKAKAVKDFLAERLKSTRDSLSKQEMDLRNYQQGNSILGMGEQTTDLISANSKLETDAAETQIQISTIAKKIQESKRQYRNYDSTLPAEISSAVPLYIEQMQRELTQLDVDEQLIKATNQARASEEWYQKEIRNRDEKIRVLREKLFTEVSKYKASMVNSMGSGTKGDGSSTSALGVLRQQIFDDEIQHQALQAKLSAITGKRAEIQGKMSQVPGQMLDMERLQRDKAGFEKIYMQLNEDYNRKVLEEQSVFSSVRLLETAQVLPSPISPNRPADIATGSFAGLGLGIGIVLLIAFIDTTIHTPEELEKNGFVMLTAIPTIRSDMFDTNAVREDITVTGKVSPHLITQVNPKSPVAEAYRSLRTGIQYASIEEATRTILVTSSTPQEGKSTTSVNTAIVFAQSGSKTLLIDCDLRRPIVHSVFGMAKEPGLVNCLIGSVPIDEAVYHTMIPNLDVLASGSIPPNPSELLGSRRMRDLLDELRLRYDTIILDSPPTAAVTDAVILSTLADITIVVVRAHKTKLEFLEKTRTELERVFVSPLGVVLNDFDVSQSYGSAYKYYRYYKYYGYYGQSTDAGSRRKQRRADAVRNLPPADGV